MAVVAAISRICSFGGVSLQSIANINVYSIDYDAMERSLGIFEISRVSARKTSSAFYQARRIYVSIYITAANRAAADQAIDNLMAIIQGVEGQLIIEQSGGVRAYTCTYQKMAKNNSGVGKANVAPPSGGYDDFTLVFECSDSFGYDTTAQTIYNLTNQTASLNNYPYTQGGTADTQVPIIQVQLNLTPSGNTNASVTVGNQATGQAAVITRTWSQYDILLVDSLNKKVQVNGVDTAFTGAIPEFGTGSQTIYVQDTFTARNYRVIAQVTNRYL